MLETAKSVFADGPGLAPQQPDKARIRALLTYYEQVMEALKVNGTFQGPYNASVGVFPDGGTAQKGEFWLVRTPGVIAGISFAVGDSILALVNNASATIYTDNWLRLPARGQAYAIAVDAGAGTPNAIKATFDGAVEDGMPVVVTLYRATTGSPVTISINGDTPLTITTASGGNASALAAGMTLLGVVHSSDHTFRLLTDQASAALVSQAEAARDQATAVAARNDDLPWVKYGDAPTYASATSFTVAGDQTAVYVVGRRVRLKGTTPFTVFGTVSSASYLAPNTTVTVSLDSGALNSTLNEVAAGVIPAGESIPNPLPLKRATITHTAAGKHALEINKSGGGNGYAIRVIGDSVSEMIYLNPQGESSPGVPVNEYAITRFDSEGGVIMGSPIAKAVGDISPTEGYFPRFQIFGYGGSATGSFVMGQFMNDASYSTFFLAKSRGLGSRNHAIVQNGDTLGRIAFMGDDGSDIKTLAASISAVVNAAPGADKIPAKLSFITMDAAGAVAERGYMDSAGWHSTVGTYTLTNAGAVSTVLNLVNADSTAGTAARINFQPSTSNVRTGSARVENKGGNAMDFVIGLSAGGNEADKFKVKSAGYLCIPDGVAAPTANEAGFAQLFVDAADGDLKIRFADGVVKTIVVDT